MDPEVELTPHPARSLSNQTPDPVCFDSVVPREFSAGVLKPSGIHPESVLGAHTEAGLVDQKHLLVLLLWWLGR